MACGVQCDLCRTKMSPVRHPRNTNTKVSRLPLLLQWLGVVVGFCCCSCSWLLLAACCSLLHQRLVLNGGDAVRRHNDDGGDGPGAISPSTGGQLPRGCAAAICHPRTCTVYDCRRDCRQPLTIVVQVPSNVTPSFTYTHDTNQASVQYRIALELVERGGKTRALDKADAPVRLHGGVE